MINGKNNIGIKLKQLKKTFSRSNAIQYYLESVKKKPWRTIKKKKIQQKKKSN